MRTDKAPGRHAGLDIGDYQHYLHHKYFTCRYGVGGFILFDNWFGAFHDGSDEAWQALKRRARRGLGSAR